MTLRETLTPTGRDASAPRAATSATGLFSLADLPSETLHGLVARATEFARDLTRHDSPLRGHIIGVWFTKTSTRTRTSFTTAAIRLGGDVVAYGPHDLQTNTGETLEDTARVLGSMLDTLVMRTAGPVDELRRVSAAGAIPVVNAMAAEEHPTQGLTDLATIAVAFGALAGVRVLYVGEGNNTAVALAYALSTVPGARLVLATPPGYGIPGPTLAETATRARSRGGLVEAMTIDAVSGEFDVVYTTRWQTTGTSKADPVWRETFRPYYVDEKLMRRWPNARFMHDLPAHRGEDVSAAVLDGPRSLAWRQAQMKMFSAMAVLEWVATQSPAGATVLPL